MNVYDVQSRGMYLFQYLQEEDGCGCVGGAPQSGREIDPNKVMSIIVDLLNESRTYLELSSLGIDRSSLEVIT